jgi:hypothetical protein
MNSQIPKPTNASARYGIYKISESLGTNTIAGVCRGLQCLMYRIQRETPRFGCAGAWRAFYRAFPCHLVKVRACGIRVYSSSSSSGGKGFRVSFRKSCACSFAVIGLNADGTWVQSKQSERSSERASAYPSDGKSKTSSANFRMLPKSCVTWEI